jgi:hypothetical protein
MVYFLSFGDMQRNKGTGSGGVRGGGGGMAGDIHIIVVQVFEEEAKVQVIVRTFLY